MDADRRFLSYTYAQWVIVLAIFICCILWSGCGYFAFSLFVKPLQADLGWDRSTIMAAFMFWSLTVGIACIIAGKAVDRYGARRVMLAGGIITALGYMSLSLMNSIIHFYLGFIIVGAGIASMGQVPCTTIISNWFHQKRGLALGLTSTGVGFGGLLISPLLGSFIIPSFGWRTAYFVLGVMNGAIVIPLALFVIKSRPDPEKAASEEEHQREAGKKRPLSKGPPDETGPERPFLSLSLWLIAVTVFFNQFSLTGSLQSQVPHLEDIGFHAATAATLLGGVGLMSSVSKFFFGWLCDLIKVKYAFLIALLLEAGGTFILMNMVPESHRSILWLYVLVMGLGAGSWLPIMSMFISTIFGLRAYGTLFGVVNFTHSIGVAAGPIMAGYIFDIQQDYHTAFVIFMVVYLFAGLSAIFVRKS